MQETTIFSVHDVNEYVKAVIEEDPALQKVSVRGEISNFTLHSSGHMYFTLKDDGGTLKSVMFKGSNRYLTFSPQNGTKVVVKGNVSVYTKNGQYQLIVTSMQEDGIGNLYLAYEELKRKLEAEGLFDPRYKQQIPSLPNQIGIITSPTGAAVHDMVSTIQRRYPLARIVFLPVLVQGEGAPESVASAIEQMDQYGELDVLIVGRGGGSIEDLWAFNDERVARAIYASNTPIISAVGHETDFTIADFVADLRAPTPTGAAEIATNITIQELQAALNHTRQQLHKTLTRKFEQTQERVNRLQRSLERKHPKRQLQDAQQELDQLMDRFRLSSRHVLKQNEHALHVLVGKLDALSPLKTLARGFSVAYKDESVVSSTEQVAVNDQIEVTLKKGSVLCTIDEIKEESSYE